MKRLLTLALALLALSAPAAQGQAVGFNDAWSKLGTADFNRADEARSNTARYPFNWTGWRDSATFRAKIASVVAEFNARGIRPILVPAGLSRPNVPEYAAAVVQIAATFNGDIRGIEVWNEPNISVYGGYNHPGYIDLFNYTRSALAAWVPSMTVASAGLAPTGNWRWYLKQISQQPGDFALSAHIYPSGFGDPPMQEAWQDRDDVLEAAALADGDRPVWITETGLSSGTLGEARQADLMPRLLTVLDEPPAIKTIIVHRLRDDPTFYPDSEWEQGLGVLRANGTPKPVFEEVFDAVLDTREAFRSRAERRG